MKNETILKYAAEVFEEAKSIRRKLHENPELGNSESETTKLIKTYLKENKIAVFQPLETGAIGLIDAGKEQAVAFRADIDALPVFEKTGLPYASKVDGVMHACGHDIHTASLLAAAKVMSAHRDDLKKNVVLIFQPDEEGNGGAKRITDTGLFEKYNVRQTFGIHVRPELGSKTVAVKFGKSYAASDVFEVIVHGKSSHGAEPQNGKNALVAASHIVTALEGIVPRNISPTDSAVLSICTFESGSAVNIIPDTAKIGGIIRTLGSETRKKVKAIFEETVECTAKAFGCDVQIYIRESYPGVVNSDNETQFAQSCAEELFSKENVCVLSEPTMTTEDFGYYLMRAPGCFFHVGAECEAPLHSPHFSPNEECIKTAVAMYIKLALENQNISG